MSGQPELGTLTKLKLAAFAAEISAKHPSEARTVLALQDTLETRLAKNPALQDEIIRKLNANTSGTLSNARAMIDKDPKILQQINADPTKLGALMGIKVAQAAPAPAQAAPAPAQAAAAPARSEPAKAEPAKPAAPKAEPAKAEPAKVEPAKVEPAKVAAQTAAPAEVAAKPLSDQEVALRSELAQESLKVTQMKGFDELAAKADKSQSLSQAIDSIMGKDAQNPQSALTSLKDLQKDPEFFVKANAFIDQIPEQSRDMAFTQIAQNPDLAKRAIGGDKNAENEMRTKVMMGGLFGGGPEGKGGLAGLFQGDGLKGIGEMFQKIMPMMMDLLKGFIGKIMGGIEKLAGNTGLMRVGNNPEGTGALVQKVGQSLGVDAGNTPVLDANKPGEPAVPVAQLGTPQPEIKTPGQVREFEQRQGLTGPGVAPA